MGLVLNRPAAVAAADAVPQLGGLIEPDDPVYLGGPVQPSAVVALAELEDPSEAAAIVFDDVGFLPADADPDRLADSARQVRIFAGYAGWGPGQLEAELEQSAWIVFEAPEAGEVFPVAPGELWSAVLRRKGGPFALLALMPLDPSMN